MFSSVLLPASILNTHILQNFSSYLLTSYYLLTSQASQHFKYRQILQNFCQHFEYQHILRNFFQLSIDIPNHDSITIFGNSKYGWKLPHFNSFVCNKFIVWASASISVTDSVSADVAQILIESHIIVVRFPNPLAFGSEFPKSVFVTAESPKREKLGI